MASMNSLRSLPAGRTLVAGVSLSAVVFVLGGLAGCSREPRPTASCDTRIASTRILAVETGEIVADVDLLIGEGRILAISPASTRPSQHCDSEIDGSGWFVTPGLIDAHVHLRGVDQLELYLSAGVTSVRTMNGPEEALDWRAAIESGNLAGPHLVVASPVTTEESREGWSRVQSPEDARRRIADYLDLGYDLVKVYELSEPLFMALAEEAGRAGLRIGGHYPIRGEIDSDPAQLHRVLESGIDTLEHIEEVYELLDFYSDSEETTTAFLATLREKEVIATTVLSRLERNYPDYDLEPVLRFIRLAWESHLTIAIGTDSNGDSIPAGVSVHDELSFLADSGLPAEAILGIATLNGAAALGLADSGSLRPGAVADLLVVDRDPVADLSALRRPVGVMVAGRWWKEPHGD